MDDESLDVLTVGREEKQSASGLLSDVPRGKRKGSCRTYFLRHRHLTPNLTQVKLRPLAREPLPLTRLTLRGNDVKRPSA